MVRPAAVSPFVWLRLAVLLGAATSMRIEFGDPARPDVCALLEEHLRSMHASFPSESVHALDVSRLRNPDITSAVRVKRAEHVKGRAIDRLRVLALDASGARRGAPGRLSGVVQHASVPRALFGSAGLPMITVPTASAMVTVTAQGGVWFHLVGGRKRADAPAQEQRNDSHRSCSPAAAGRP